MTNLLSKSEKVQAIKKWLEKTELSSEVLGQTLGVSASHVSPSVLLSTSSKLIKINRGETEPDDRDNLKFSKFMGLEDFVKEHIEKDAGKLQRKAKWRMDQKKNLSWLSSGFFNPQVRSTIIGNSLSQNVEGINPVEHMDVSGRVTKLGEGGIASLDSIPDSSRQVNPSSSGFFDPYHIVESGAIGVSNFFTNNVVKGRDGKLYRLMRDSKDKKLKWVDHETILNSKVAIPEH